MTFEAITKTIRQVPTLFKIENACHGALLIAAAQKVVKRQQQRIIHFIEAQ